MSKRIRHVGLKVEPEFLFIYLDIVETDYEGPFLETGVHIAMGLKSAAINEKSIVSKGVAV